jgi:hypothetical protein
MPYGLFQYTQDTNREVRLPPSKLLHSQFFTVRQVSWTLGNKNFERVQLFAHFYSLKGTMFMKPLNFRRVVFLALGVMVAILVILTTSVFGMTM